MSKTTALRFRIVKNNIDKNLGHHDWEILNLKNKNDEDTIHFQENVVIHCLKHDYYTQKKVGTLKTGSNPTICPFCQNKKPIRIPISLIKKECYKHNLEFCGLKDESSLNLEEWTLINSKTSIYCKCNKHEKFLTNYDSITSGRNCPFCAHEKVGKRSRLKIDEVIKRLNENNCDLEKIEYSEIGSVVYYRCRFHQDVIQRTLLGNLTARYGCPLCSSSKGERKIRSVLKDFNIKFQEQKTFDGCVFKKKLRFDFYLPDYNLCIEYQGAQHYQPPIQWGDKKLSPEEQQDEFSLIQKRDYIKKKYCKENNITLLEISYKNYKRIKEIIWQEILDSGKD